MATALHELGHWTGHWTRLNRDLSGRFGSGAYAHEDCGADLASVFVGTTPGLAHRYSAACELYAKLDQRPLKNDKREIFHVVAGTRSALQTLP